MEEECSNEGLKITWKDLKDACERAGVQDNDTLDMVHITWGDAKHLKCSKDADFGWQIQLDCDCGDA